MSTGNIAEVTTTIHEPIERVWHALVDPKLIARYMMGAKVTTDWKEGSTIIWEGEWKGKPFADHGRLLAVREPDLLKYTHISGTSQATEEQHTVTVELKEVGGATHLHLTQDNNASEQAREESEKNWTMMLDGLKKVLGEAPVEKPEQQRV